MIVKCKVCGVEGNTGTTGEDMWTIDMFENTLQNSKCDVYLIQTIFQYFGWKSRFKFGHICKDCRLKVNIGIAKFYNPFKTNLGKLFKPK